jgi:hypothetical protein
VARVLGQDALVERERGVGIVQLGAQQLRQAEGDLTPLGALPFLGPPQRERPGQLLDVVQLRVEPIQHGGGLSLSRIALGDRTPRGGRARLVRQPRLMQQRRLAQVGHLLRGLCGD